MQDYFENIFSGSIFCVRIILYYYALRKKVLIIHLEHIKTVQHNIGNGITEPKLGMTYNDIPVVIKTYNGPEGQLVLFNEYLCYRLAILLDIPMPISGVCIIDQHTLIYNDCVTLNQYGYGFYSTHLNKAVTLVETIVPLMKNKEIFFKILLFDHIIFNADRNPGNLLVQYYKKNITLQVIDHSHVFKNGPIWDASCLRRFMSERDYLSTEILEANEYLYSMFYHNISISQKELDDLKVVFSNTITASVLHRIISDIPKEWCPSDTDIGALIEYLLYRIQHIDEICSTILKYLKN